jgi:hypothetical protein
MTKEIRDSFIIYRSFIEAARDLPKIERVDLYEAIFDLALDGKENKLNGLSATIFKVIKPNILANTKRYKDGKKGGRKSTKKTSGSLEDETSGSKNEKPVGGKEKEPNKDVNYNYNQNKDVKSEIIIPNFIDQILLDEFLQQRKKDKNPIGGLALKLIFEDLQKWENEKQGNANLALRNAIKGGWKSLVEPKQNNFNNNQTQSQEKKNLLDKLNKIAGEYIFLDIEQSYNSVTLHCSNSEKLANLPDDAKNKIRAEFPNIEKFKIK